MPRACGSRLAAALDDVASARADAQRRQIAAETEVGDNPLSIHVDVLRRHGLRESWHDGGGLPTWFGGRRVTTSEWDAAVDRETDARARVEILRDELARDARTAAATVADATSSAFGDSDSWFGALLSSVGIDDVWDAVGLVGDLLGTVSTVCGVLSLLTVWFPPVSGALATTALVAGSGALLCTAAAVSEGKEEPSELALDALGVATGGLGRVLATGGRAIRAGSDVRGAATQAFDHITSSGLPAAFDEITSGGLPTVSNRLPFVVRGTARDVPVATRSTTSSIPTDLPTDRGLMLATGNVMASVTVTTVDAGHAVRDLRGSTRDRKAAAC